MLAIENMSYSYDASERPSLVDINFEITEGSFVLLTGPSGSGKSTLLHCINGLNPLHYAGERRGSIHIDGHEICGKELWEISKSVGTIFQNPSTQFFQSNVEDEIAFGLEFRRLDPDEIERRISEYSRRMRVDHLLHRDLFSISSGERQKVAITSVAALGQPILLFDEPSANLDPDAVRDLVEILRELKNDGRTIIIAEHRIHYLREMLDRAIVLEGGRIEYDGPPEALNDKSFRERFGLRMWSFPDTYAEGAISDRETSVMRAEQVSFTVARRKTLVNDAWLSVAPGECLGIAGPNGTGKTTLARILAGLEPRATGQVYLEARQVPSKKRIGRIVYVAQQADQQLFADTVHEELAMGVGGNSRTDEIVGPLLESLDLEPLRDAHPHALSGGEKQRLAVAAAIVLSPKVLILDEPTTGMDGRRLRSFAGEIKRLQEQGVGVIIITHDYEFIHRCTSRVLWMENGTTTRIYDRTEYHELLEWFGAIKKGEAELCSR